MSYFPTDIPYMSEAELEAYGITINRPEKPDNAGLRECPFCGGEAKSAITESGTKGPAEFFAHFSIGCDNCGLYFTGESEYKIMKDGKIEVMKDGYKEAAAKWNRRDA